MQSTSILTRFVDFLVKLINQPKVSVVLEIFIQVIKITNRYLMTTCLINVLFFNSKLDVIFECDNKLAEVVHKHGSFNCFMWSSALNLCVLDKLHITLIE